MMCLKKSGMMNSVRKVVLNERRTPSFFSTFSAFSSFSGCLLPLTQHLKTMAIKGLRSVAGVVACLASVFVALQMGLMAQADSWIHSESEFLVLTKKGGIASALAHNHIIAAEKPTIVVVGSERQAGVGAGSDDSLTLPKQVKFMIGATDLVVDDPVRALRVFPRLKELGLSEEPYETLSEDDRKTVKENMLAKDQLWAEKYSEISVTLSSISAAPAQTPLVGKIPATHLADAEFTIRGKTVPKKFPLLIESANGSVVVEGVLEAAFEEFGFKAYSALLGALKNKDHFHFYFRVKGQWTAE